jgi:hypothetical protein
MKKILNCRRSLLAIFGISCLTCIGLVKGVDISGIAMAISGIVASVSVSNAYQGKDSKPSDKS